MEIEEIDREDFRSLLNEIGEMRMPFGKFGPTELPPRGCWLCDLPIEYLVWFSERGFPKGRLGELMQAVHDIKANGMDEIFSVMRQAHGGRTKLRPQKKKSFTFE
jgi:uncharacterized protein